MSPTPREELVPPVFSPKQLKEGFRVTLGWGGSVGKRFPLPPPNPPPSALSPGCSHPLPALRVPHPWAWGGHTPPPPPHPPVEFPPRSTLRPRPLGIRRWGGHGRDPEGGIPGRGVEAHGGGGGWSSKGVWPFKSKGRGRGEGRAGPPPGVTSQPRGGALAGSARRVRGGGGGGTPRATPA